MQAITTKYYGPTNHKGSRIRATSGNGRSYVTVPYRHELGADENHDEAARELCARLKWKGTLMRGERTDGNVYVWATATNWVEVI